MKSILKLVGGIGLGLIISGCVIAARPKITKIYPQDGPTYGGYQMVILGKNFDDAPMVFLGNKKLKIKKVEHFSQITVEIPKGNAGKLAVVVQNGDNSQAIATEGFEYMKFPHIDLVVPSSGPSGGGTWIKITGEYFDPNAQVYFGKNKAKNPKINFNQIMVISPPGPKGAIKISITNPNGNSHLYQGYYTYE